MTEEGATAWGDERAAALALEDRRAARELEPESGFPSRPSGSVETQHRAARARPLGGRLTRRRGPISWGARGPIPPRPQGAVTLDVRRGRARRSSGSRSRASGSAGAARALRRKPIAGRVWCAVSSMDAGQRRCSRARRAVWASLRAAARRRARPRRGSRRWHFGSSRPVAPDRLGRRTSCVKRSTGAEHREQALRLRQFASSAHCDATRGAPCDSLIAECARTWRHDICIPVTSGSLREEGVRTPGG